jgi:hypothetical protein
MKSVVALAATLGGVALLSSTSALAAQDDAEKRGSDNIEVVSHLPLGAPGSVSDIEVEQDMDRPFVYIGREVLGQSEGGDRGIDVIDIADPSDPKVIHRWRIEDSDLHVGAGGKDIKAFSWEGRHYVVLSVQFRQGGPDYDLGAIIFDVTGLPDPSTFKEVARIQGPQELGGFHNIFTYRHSNGRALLFATTTSPAAHVYDLGYVLEGRSDEALVARIPVPGENAQSYHDFYTGYHADSEQDRFYGGGTGGYYVFNVTDLENPELLVTLTGISGIEWGHTFTPSPDGRYVVAEAEYQYAPLRMFDLKPALDGEVSNIRSPISAWTANWEHLVHNHEVRWPFVFVSGYLDGLQVFSMQDPKKPRTIAHYDTYLEGEDEGVMSGAWGTDVRNADGLIVVSDMVTGFWAFRMEGFKGWNGLDWGQPNISSVQDWENGPEYQARTRY